SWVCRPLRRSVPGVIYRRGDKGQHDPYRKGGYNRGGNTVRTGAEKYCCFQHGTVSVLCADEGECAGSDGDRRRGNGMVYACCDLYEWRRFLFRGREGLE